ncbi:MAG TPA: hypothetical protein VIG50_06165 [Vicinamibacteria bacterium]
MAEGTGVGLGAAGEPPPPQAPSDAATAAAITATTAERVALRTIVTSLRLPTGVPETGHLTSQAGRHQWFSGLFRFAHRRCVWVRNVGTVAERVTLEFAVTR